MLSVINLDHLIDWSYKNGISSICKYNFMYITKQFANNHISNIKISINDVLKWLSDIGRCNFHSINSISHVTK